MKYALRTKWYDGIGEFLLLIQLFLKCMIVW